MDCFSANYGNNSLKDCADCLILKRFYIWTNTLLFVKVHSRSRPSVAHYSLVYSQLTPGFLSFTFQSQEYVASSGGPVVKNLSANAGDLRSLGSIPRLGRSPGEGNGNPFQYSCLENSMERGAWLAIYVVLGVPKS